MATNPRIQNHSNHTSIDSSELKNDRINMVSNNDSIMLSEKQPIAAIVRKKSLEQQLFNPVVSMQTPPKPKKGGFQITRVVTKTMGNHLTDDHDVDSVDDLDETNTEDMSSDLLDLSTSKLTDIDQDPSSTDTIQSFVPEDASKEVKTKISPPSASTQAPLPPNHTAGPGQTSNQLLSTTAVIQPILDVKPNEGQSTRFKVVKIESKEPFKRGRWMCLDFLDPPQKPIIEGLVDKALATDRTEKLTEEVGSGNSSAASSVHYVPGVDDPANLFSNIVYSEGHMIVEPQPIRPLVGGAQTILANGGDYAQAPIPTADGSVIPNPNSNAPMTLHPQVPSSGESSAPPQQYSQPSSQAAPQPSGQQDFSTHSIPQASTQDFSSQPGPNASLPPPAASQNEFGNQQAPAAVPSGAPSNNASPSNELMQGSAEFTTEQQRYGGGDEKQLLLSIGASASHRPLSQSGLTLQMVMQPSLKDDDEGGASTVAIDNKIEQAMDLVKSHLMFAVREEVDILKEQIKELLEKNSQLEMENNLLRSSASPETLSQLPPPGAAANANAAAANAAQPATSTS